MSPFVLHACNFSFNFSNISQNVICPYLQRGNDRFLVYILVVCSSYPFFIIHPFHNLVTVKLFNGRCSLSTLSNVNSTSFYDTVSSLPADKKHEPIVATIWRNLCELHVSSGHRTTTDVLVQTKVTADDLVAVVLWYLETMPTSHAPEQCLETFIECNGIFNRLIYGLFL